MYFIIIIIFAIVVSIVIFLVTESVPDFAVSGDLFAPVLQLLKAIHFKS